jgi:hypothetical protein
MTTYTIHIDQPCSEHWDDMQSTATGKFCHSCSRTLVDFTNMSDHQLIMFLNTSKGKICGRLNEGQIDRALIENPEQKSRPAFYRFLAAILLLYNHSLSFKANAQLKAGEQLRQEIVSMDTITTQQKQDDSIHHKNVIFKSSIRDLASKQGIAGASIKLIGTDLVWKTDSSGNFHIVVPAEYQNGESIFEVSCEGYNSIKIPIQLDPHKLTPHDYMQAIKSTVLGKIGVRKSVPEDSLKLKPLPLHR